MIKVGIELRQASHPRSKIDLSEITGSKMNQPNTKIEKHIVVEPEITCMYPSGTVREHADWARRNEKFLRRPYPTALYLNKRSGIQWQIYDEIKDGRMRLRRIFLKDNYFAFMWTIVPTQNLSNPKIWTYIGPTPEDHEQYGYDTYSAQGYLLDGYILRK